MIEVLKYTGRSVDAPVDLVPKTDFASGCRILLVTVANQGPGTVTVTAYQSQNGDYYDHDLATVKTVVVRAEEERSIELDVRLRVYYCVRVTDVEAPGATIGIMIMGSRTQ